MLYHTLVCYCVLVGVNGFNFYSVVFLDNVFFFNFGSWIRVGLLDVRWEFMLDFLAVSMLLMVSCVSALVHFYSFSYMKTDPHFIRFMSYLSLFTFFMFCLVSAANLVVLFLGWEGVGICSYLLINFWYTRVQANKAALKALFMNRVGDLGFLFGVCVLFTVCKTVDFSALAVLAPLIAEGAPVFTTKAFGVIYYFDAICFAFFIGVVGKSAQVGLHTWLPAAMEGPTPVSALIHAATMVTAGIFLLIRCSFLFECSTNVKMLVVIFGVATACFSAFTALFLYDMKRIIAYSTCSQLGYMAVACGLSQYTLGFFHLINHAFFKALLFLTAGAIIHSFNNEQDIRKLHTLAVRMPFIHSCVLVGSVAIMGLPFLSGFYSKDLIIECVYLNSTYLLGGSYFFYYGILFATLCTGLYSMRLYYYLFLRGGVSQGRLAAVEQPFFIQAALSLLMLGSIFSGYVCSELFSLTTPWGVSSLNNAQLVVGVVDSFMYFENEVLPWYVKLLPFFCNVFVVFSCMGFIFCYQNTQLLPSLSQFLVYTIYVAVPYVVQVSEQHVRWFEYMQIMRKGYYTVARLAFFNFYFNEVYNYVAYQNVSYYFTHVFLNTDKGLLELLGPLGAAKVLRRVVRFIVRYYKLGATAMFYNIYHFIVFYFFLFE